MRLAGAHRLPDGALLIALPNWFGEPQGWGHSEKGGAQMNVDAFFTGPLLTGRPDLRDQAGRKMPGAADSDNQGDHCD
jgi:hypothetical protein